MVQDSPLFLKLGLSSLPGETSGSGNMIASYLGQSRLRTGPSSFLMSPQILEPYHRDVCFFSTEESVFICRKGKVWVRWLL